MQWRLAIFDLVLEFTLLTLYFHTQLQLPKNIQFVTSGECWVNCWEADLLKKLHVTTVQNYSSLSYCSLYFNTW